MSDDEKKEKDLLKGEGSPKHKDSEGVDKTVEDLLKSTLSGLGIEPEKRKEILGDLDRAGKTEPSKFPPAEKKEPPARKDAFEIKPPEKPAKVDSSSWLKEPPAKPEPSFKKDEPSIFKPESPPKKVEPKIEKEKEKKKEEFPDFPKKEDVLLGGYAEPEKKKAKPIVPIIAGGALIAVLAIILLFVGGKKEPAKDTRQAATTVKPDVSAVEPASDATVSTDILETVPASEEASEPPVKVKTPPAEKAAASGPASEKRPAAEASLGPDAASAPLVPVDPNAVKVQEIKPTRTQPTTAAPSGTTAGEGAAPKTTLGQLVDITVVDTTPVLVRRVEPVYPPLAFRMKAEGSVTIKALIDETGAVVRTEVLKTSGGPYGFEKAARDAVMKWRYRPAVKDSTYVKVWIPVIMTFAIQD
ncbi:MAG: TonB family protein [Candidatus Aminicenantes bacterium]|nr:TonB family protein [Candidatus Aminicenantes bacterium]